MTENRVYGGLLVVLLFLAYLSWHHEPPEPGSSAVVLAGAAPEALERVRLETRSATVTVDARQAPPWIVVEQAGRRFELAGNSAFEKARAELAELEALRSLGRPSGEARERTGLEAPQGHLEVSAAGKTVALELGKKTPGGRDWYAQRAGDDEVLLLSGTLVTDLLAARGRFMQRQVVTAAADTIAKARIEAGGVTLEVIHGNRLSPRDAFWARSDTPEVADAALGNYLEKARQLPVQSYPPKAELPVDPTPVLTLSWLGGSDELLEQMALFRAERDGTLRYYAESPATGRLAELPRSTAEQLERDLSLVLDGG